MNYKIQLDHPGIKVVGIGTTPELALYELLCRIPAVQMSAGCEIPVRGIDGLYVVGCPKTNIAVSSELSDAFKQYLNEPGFRGTIGFGKGEWIIQRFDGLVIKGLTLKDAWRHFQSFQDLYQVQKVETYRIVTGNPEFVVGAGDSVESAVHSLGEVVTFHHSGVDIGRVGNQWSASDGYGIGTGKSEEAALKSMLDVPFVKDIKIRRKSDNRWDVETPDALVYGPNLREMVDKILGRVE